MAQQPQPATRPLPDIADPDKQSFLKLPAEVRHQIYAYWAEEVLHVGVRARGKAHTTSAHPVGGASRRLHKEFGGVLGEVSVANAQQVKIKVVDMDFYPAQEFLRRVDADPRADYHDFRRVGGRSLIVELHFTDAFNKNPWSDRIGKWFRYRTEKVPGLELTTRIVEVVDRAKTGYTIQQYSAGQGASPLWREIANVFAEWEWENFGRAEMQAEEALEDALPKTREDQELDEAYEAICAEMDARDRGVGDHEYEAEVKEEDVER